MTGLKGNPVQVRNSTRCCNPALAARPMKWFADNVTVPLISGWEGRQNPGKVRRPAAFFFNASGIKQHNTMNHTSVPPSGTGWFRALRRAMRNWLFEPLLRHFTIFVQNHSFGPPFGLPVHFLTIGTGCSSLRNYPPILFQAAWIDLSCFDVCPDMGNCRWFACETFACESFALEGNTLTSFPLWRNS